MSSGFEKIFEFQFLKEDMKVARGYLRKIFPILTGKKIKNYRKKVFIEYLVDGDY